jgi:hypothetical protein
MGMLLRRMCLLFVFIVALSMALTVVLYGGKVLVHGLLACGAALQQGQWGLLLRPPCSCALFELLLLFFSGGLIAWSGPLLRSQLDRRGEGSGATSHLH